MRHPPSAAVEEFDLTDGMDDGAPPLHGRPRRRVWSSPLPWGAAAVALVLVGSATAHPLVQLLDGEPGVELGITDLPLQEPPTLMWEVSFRSSSIVGVVDGRALVRESAEAGATAGDSGSSVVALDLATGEEIWRQPDPEGTCTSGPRVTCLGAPGTAQATIIAITPSDGTRVVTPHPGAIGVIAAGDDVVVVEEGAAGIEDVVLIERDGGERWRVKVDAADTEGDSAWAPLRVNETDVVLDYAGTVIDLATGTQNPRPRYPLGDDQWLELASDGNLLVHSGDRSIALEPDEAVAWFDDDAGGPIALHQADTGEVFASIRGTSEELWRTTGTTCYPQVRLEHRFVLSCWDAEGRMRTIGVDELTGETRWRLEGSTWPIIASSDTVLLGSDTGTILLALDPVSGDTRWELPGRLSYLQTIADGEGGLLVAGEDSIRRLAWD